MGEIIGDVSAHSTAAGGPFWNQETWSMASGQVNMASALPMGWHIFQLKNDLTYCLIIFYFCH